MRKLRWFGSSTQEVFVKPAYTTLPLAPFATAGTVATLSPTTPGPGAVLTTPTQYAFSQGILPRQTAPMTSGLAPTPGPLIPTMPRTAPPPPVATLPASPAPATAGTTVTFTPASPVQAAPARSKGVPWWWILIALGLVGGGVAAGHYVKKAA